MSTRPHAAHDHRCTDIRFRGELARRLGPRFGRLGPGEFEELATWVCRSMRVGAYVPPVITRDELGYVLRLEHGARPLVADRRGATLLSVAAVARDARQAALASNSVHLACAGVPSAWLRAG